MNDNSRPSHPGVLKHYNERTEQNVHSTTDEVIYMNLNQLKSPSVEIRIVDERQSADSFDPGSDSGYESIEVFRGNSFVEDEAVVK